MEYEDQGKKEKAMKGEIVEGKMSGRREEVKCEEIFENNEWIENIEDIIC